MSNINRIILSGRLTKDFTQENVKYFETGSIKVSNSIAVNEWNKKENKEDPHFFDIEIWGKQAEFLSEYGKKGDLIMIEGKILKSNWTDEQGNNKSRVYINVQNLELPHNKRD